MSYIYLAYRYRIYPTEQQAHKLELTFSATTTLYNVALDDMIRHYEHTGEILTPQLDDYIREPHYSFRGLDFFPLLSTLSTLEKDFSTALVKDTYPAHRKYKWKWSYCSTTAGTRFSIVDSYVDIPFIGMVKIVLHRELPSRPLNATVIKEFSGDYYISFLVKKKLDKPDFATPTFENCIGLDYSNPHFYIDSDGNKAPNHKHFYKEEKEHLEREVAKLKRKQKGSSNYYKQLRKVNKLQAKIANRRKDWLHKESKRLADTYEFVGVEDLDLQAIISTYNLGENAMDNSYGMFIRMLDYKLAAQGKVLFKVNRWLPTSQTCNNCGYVNKNLTLGDRFWKCPKCNRTISRDHNAASNIKDEIIKYLG